MSTDLSSLEARIQQLEDERAIQRLIASYGPRVDAADADGAAALWESDGSYDVEGWRMNSSDDVRAMVSSPSHRELVTGGCCHFLGPTVITVTGETAVALCESLVLLRHEKPTPGTTFKYAAWNSSPNEYVVWRATANHFELALVDGTWRITARTSRMLNGDPAAHELLAAGLAGEPVQPGTAH